MNAVRSYCCASVPSACAAASKRICLLLDALLFLRLRDRRDEGDLAALGEDPVRRLAARRRAPSGGTGTRTASSGSVARRRWGPSCVSLPCCRLVACSAATAPPAARGRTGSAARSRHGLSDTSAVARRFRHSTDRYARRSLAQVSLEPMGTHHRGHARSAHRPARTAFRLGPTITCVRLAVPHLHRTMHSRSSTLRR